MKKISKIIVIALVLCVTLCGCTLINGIFKNDKKGSAPTNVAFDESTCVLSWDKVENSSGYEVAIKDSASVETVLTTETESIDLSEFGGGAFSVRVRGYNGNKKYDYSDSIDIRIIMALTVDESSITANYENSTLIVTWRKVDHADGYSISYEYKGNTVKSDVTDCELIVPDYEQMSICRITIIAKGSGNYKDGRRVVYTYFGKPDYNNVYGTITVDKLDIKPAVFGFGYLVAAVLDENIDIREFIEPTADKFVIPSDYLLTLSAGEHFVYLVGTDAGRVYKLVVNDNREPEFVIGNYVKHGEDLKGILEPYGNKIDAVCGFYAPIDESYYKIENNEITLFSDYLDTVADGELRLNIRYENTLDADYHYLPFIVTISTENAELTSTSYEFDGDDLVVSLKTHGDKVLSVKTGNIVLASSDYTTSKNELVISKSFLLSGNYESFAITTERGAILYFQVSYAINGFLPDKEIYSFDKASKSNLAITGSSADKSVVLFGNSLTPSDYVYDGQLLISGDFLSAKKSGYYDFSAYANGAITNFKVKVFDSNGTINDLKLDYDLSADETYITFNCDCGETGHYYILDGNANTTENPCENMQKVFVDRTVGHTLAVKCENLGKTAAFSINPPKAALEYVESHISINGVVADKYIDSFDEFVFLLQYLSNGGSGVTVTSESPDGQCSERAYFSDSFANYIDKNGDFFEQANYRLDLSYPCNISLSRTGAIATITVKFGYNPDVAVESGKTTEELLDTSVKLSEGARSDSFDGFAINSFERTEKITTIGELEYLSYGVKPLFDKNSTAEKTYKAALSVLRKYVSDDMTDFEKTAVIYDYLVSTVTYDSYALDLFELRSNANGKSLQIQKSLINRAITENADLTAFLSPLLSLSDEDTLFKTLNTKVSSLSSFSSYGALVNRVAVCDGIASAFKLMCLIEGIDCLEVSGVGITKSGSENHAWNKVKIDGKWYIVDATWGRSAGYVNHRYFLIDELDASETHIEDCDSNFFSVVDVAANGKFDYYKWKNEPYGNGNLCVSSRTELKTFVALMKANGEKTIELKLDYSFTSAESEIRSLNLTCSFIVYDNVVKIFFK